jgi:type I restriction enzyme S subunit
MTLPDGWTVVPVSYLSSKEKYSCVGGPFGSSLTRKDYVEYEGVPISRGTNLKIGSRVFVDDKFVYVSQDKAKKLINNSAVRGDIILTQRGTIGQVAIIPDNSRYERYILSQNQMKITLDKSKVNPLYFLYYFLSNKVQNKIQQIAIGGVIPGFNLTQFREFDVVLPTLSEQNRIVSILDDLDKKIELNSQTNQTLEQIAQAIFKSWFVDFEPTKAKIVARKILFADYSKENLVPTTEEIAKVEQQAAIQSISSEYNNVPPEQLQTLSKLFPNKFDHSELGNIPEGWDASTVGREAINKSRKFDFKEFESVVFINTGDVLKGKFLNDKVVCPEGLPGQAKKAIKSGDILYSEIRPKNKRFAFIHEKLNVSNYVVSTKFMVINTSGRLLPRYIYQFFTQKVTIDEINMTAESRSGTFPQITFDSISYLPILVPSKEMQEQFINGTLSIFNTINRNDEQSHDLISVRDTLIPKLFSGEVSLNHDYREEESV